MAKTPATQLAPGVWRIPTVGQDAVNSYALVDADGSVTLVDCGLEKAPARIVAGLEAMGKALSDVTRIVLTHIHPDHAGGTAELARRSGAAVAVHSDDAQYAPSGRPPRSDSTLLSGRVFNRLASGKFPPFEVTEPLADGDVLPVGGGLRVVHTPGHSPGHISLLHEPTRIVITGDAIFNVLGLRYSPRFLCANYRMTKQTAHVLGELDYDIAAFTHGPAMSERAREQIRAYLARPA
jgi:glyoxylase-like metal-dependent hydrolase (beta-lactamase superfamily II)